MKCPRCGKPVPGDNIICDSCGLIFDNYSNSKSDFNNENNYDFNKENNTNSKYKPQFSFQELLTANGITVEEVSAFIGEKNKTYYLNAFNKITLKNIFSNFSFGKILGIWWLFYRKMFKEFGIVLIISFLSNSSISILGNFARHTNFISNIILLLIMLFGDYIYMNSTIKNVKKIKRMYGNSPDYMNILSRSGGTLL